MRRWTEGMRKEKVKNIIQYAYEKVPFYINKREELHLSGECSGKDNFVKISDVPLVEKDEIREKNTLYSIEYLRKKDEMLCVHTSGSTGKCMEILWDKNEFNKSLLPLWLYRWKYYGIKMNDKLCYFYTSGNSDDAITNITDYEEKGNCLGFSKNNLNEKRILEIYKHMQEYKPVWINMQPSIAVLITDCIRKNQLKKIPELKYIELTGEMLFDSVREQIEKVFGCRVANQYGCYEANSIAYECPNGNLHCMEDVYVEILDDNGMETAENEDGNIVITTLENHAMPFVRYKTGDRGMINRTCKCSCGNQNPVLRLTSGRISDYAIREDGSRINSYVFVHAVETVNRMFENIIQQFQIVQKDYDYFLVNLMLDEELIDAGIGEREVENEFLNAIKDERLYDTEFSFEYYDELFPEEENGKLRYFIREVGDVDKC